jgi:hypothetical protein
MAWNLAEFYKWNKKEYFAMRRNDARFFKRQNPVAIEKRDPFRGGNA